MALAGRIARRLQLALSFLAVLPLASAPFACRTERPTAPPATPPPAPVVPRIDINLLTARVGVKPGGLLTTGVGPDASLMWSGGAVSVRRVGEDRFVDATAQTPLFSGDTVWTGPHTEATVAFADETLVQLAEESVIVVGNRALSPDPASSVALLYGVARVSVSPRSRGEGAFLTSVGTAIAAAKGTAFAAGLVAGGLVRIGVEHGEVEVAGPRALDKPLTLGPGELATLDAAGNLSAPDAFKTDDWGEWRFSVEQRAELAAAVRYHADRLLAEEARLDTDYLVLQKLATSASTLTWQAEASTAPKAAADYKATALERAAAIEATYRLATEIARLTHAALSDAFILGELRARHGDELAIQIAEFAQEIAGAQLYDKKLQLVSAIHLGPLRAAYYAHTARGRARAASLDMPPPSFAQVKLAEVPPAEITKRVPPGLYIPPRLDSTTHLHPLWQRAPKLGWDERLTLQPVPPRQGSWYVAPTRVEAHVLAGVPQTAPPLSAFPAVAATDAAKADLSFLVPPLPSGGANATTAQ
ncbi:MAG TPA: FecR domain-containing protein [Polyangia bacterium]